MVSEPPNDLLDRVFPLDQCDLKYGDRWKPNHAGYPSGVLDRDRDVEPGAIPLSVGE